MAATYWDVLTVVLPEPTALRPEGGADLVREPISFRTENDGSISTLSDREAYAPDGLVQGLLYVPTLDPAHPCVKSSEPYLPKNVTRIGDLPNMAQYALIAVAPWISDDPVCSAAYMDVVQDDPARGLMFFPTRPESAIAAPVWENNDWGTPYKQWVEWVRGKNYPIWAVPSRTGMRLVEQMALYSGNVSQAPFSEELDREYPAENAIRLLTRVTLSTARDTNPVLGRLWVFAIMILGILCLVTGLTSLFMHINQRRMRRDLRRRIANGQVDLEVLGIKRQRVPQKLLDKMPLYVYTSKTSTTEDKNKERRQSTQPFTLAQRITFPKRDVPFAQTTCPICLDDFEHNDTIVRELPCQHIFHPECVDEFLRTNSSLCPMCKKSALPTGYCPENITVSMVRRERMLRRAQIDEAGVPQVSSIMPRWSHRLLPAWFLHAHIRPLQGAEIQEQREAARPRPQAQAQTQTQTPSQLEAGPPPGPAPSQTPAELEAGPPSGPAPSQAATADLEMVAVPVTTVPPVDPQPQETSQADAQLPSHEDLPPEVQNLSLAERREWGRQRLAATLAPVQAPAEEEEVDAHGRRRGGIGRIWKRLFPS